MMYTEDGLDYKLHELWFKKNLKFNLKRIF